MQQTGFLTKLYEIKPFKVVQSPEINKNNQFTKMSSTGHRRKHSGLQTVANIQNATPEHRTLVNNNEKDRRIISKDENKRSQAIATRCIQIESNNNTLDGKLFQRLKNAISQTSHILQQSNRSKNDDVLSTPRRLKSKDSKKLINIKGSNNKPQSRTNQHLNSGQQNRNSNNLRNQKSINQNNNSSSKKIIHLSRNSSSKKSQNEGIRRKYSVQQSCTPFSLTSNPNNSSTSILQKQTVPKFQKSTSVLPSPMSIRSPSHNNYSNSQKTDITLSNYNCQSQQLSSVNLAQERIKQSEKQKQVRNLFLRYKESSQQKSICSNTNKENTSVVSSDNKAIGSGTMIQSHLYSNLTSSIDTLFSKLQKIKQQFKPPEHHQQSASNTKNTGHNNMHINNILSSISMNDNNNRDSSKDAHKLNLIKIQSNNSQLNGYSPILKGAHPNMGNIGNNKSSQSSSLSCLNLSLNGKNGLNRSSSNQYGTGMNRKISIDNNQHIFGNYNQNNNPAFFGTQALHYNACATDRANPNRIIGNNMDRRVSHHVMHTDNAIGRLSTTSTKDKNKPFFNGQYLNHLHPHTTLLPHHMNMNSEKSMQLHKQLNKQNGLHSVFSQSEQLFKQQQYYRHSCSNINSHMHYNNQVNVLRNINNQPHILNNPNVLHSKQNRNNTFSDIVSVQSYGLSKPSIQYLPVCIANTNNKVDVDQQLNNIKQMSNKTKSIIDQINLLLDSNKKINNFAKNNCELNHNANAKQNINKRMPIKKLHTLQDNANNFYECAEHKQDDKLRNGYKEQNIVNTKCHEYDQLDDQFIKIKLKPMQSQYPPQSLHQQSNNTHNNGFAFGGSAKKASDQNNYKNTHKNSVKNNIDYKIQKPLFKQQSSVNKTNSIKNQQESKSAKKKNNRQLTLNAQIMNSQQLLTQGRIIKTQSSQTHKQSKLKHNFMQQTNQNNSYKQNPRLKKQEPNAKSKLNSIYLQQSNHPPTPSILSPTKNKSKYQKSADIFAKQLSTSCVGNSQVNTHKLSMSQFNLGKCMGSGKFGDVYICKHKQTNFLYAIKKIFKSTIKQYNMVAQFIQQLKIHYTLSYNNHPNITKLYTHFQDQYHIFLLMEYIQDGTLMEQLKKSEQYVSNIIVQVLNVVQYIHRNNIAHRDIKPENILLSNGVVKLCDFGWSSIFKDQMRKTFCGTLDYVSPEMKDRGEYTTSVDLWSIGVLTFQLLTGFPPYKKQIDKWKTLGANIEKKWKWDVIFPPEISECAQNFIQRLLKEDPEQRISIRQCRQQQFIQKYENSSWSQNIIKDVFQQFERLFQ